MDFKEIARNIFVNFFIVFTCIIFIMMIYLRILGLDSIPMRDIIAAAIIAALTSSAEIILHSNREPKRLEMFIRYALHLLAVTVIALSVSSYEGWFLWSEPIQIAVFVVLILSVYIMAVAVDYYRTKQLAEGLTEKLREKYR